MGTQRQIDARGLACPQPVALTRKAISETDVDCVHVVVDSVVSSENIQRMAETVGWQTHIARQGAEIHLTLTRDPTIPREEPQPAGSAAPPRVVIFVSSDRFGAGDEKLGRILMSAFIKTLNDLATRPHQILFANSGVRLTTEGSDLIDALRVLEEQGAEILSCGTCLDYYGLLDSLRVGKTTNMYEIATSLVEADRIVHL